MKKWVIRKNKGDLKLMSETLEIDENLCQILLNRGIKTRKKSIKYLKCEFEDFGDFGKAMGVKNAIDIISDSIENGEKIVIYGDYDVDGVMSSTILYKGLTNLGANVSYYIPNRETEGYGLNKKAIFAIKSEETDLIITCDNGIASLEENRYIKELDMKLIVIDHHEPPIVTDGQHQEEIEPVADAIIDPKQSKCEYEFKQMCAAGLSFRFVCELYKTLEKELEVYDEILIFAMIATFCDIVELQGDNRIIAKKGLEYINSSQNTNIGLKELIEIKGISDKTITNYHVGFIIGPCINATGRLERATLSVELFTDNNVENCKKLAEKLYSLNEERKEYTRKSQEEIMELLENSDITKDPVFVIYNNNVHESIAGIVAGRIKETYYHPTIMITDSEEGVKGSARSIEAYNIFEELSKCQKYFTRFGGHSMAAGLSMKKELIEDFRKEINKNCKLQEEDFYEILPIDSEMNLEKVTYTLAEQITLLRPFGKGNKEPLFGTKCVKIDELKLIEDKNTIIFTFNVGEGFRQVKGISFGQVDQFKKMIEENYTPYISEKIFNGMLRNVALIIDMVYYIDINEYNKNVSVQLKLKDFRLSNS